MSSPTIDPFVDEHGEARIIRGVSALSNAPRVAELAGMVGFDTIWIEVEHGPVSWNDVEILCMAAKAGGSFPSVRIPGNDRENILRSLESGAEFVVVPMINTAADAQQLVEHGKFPPLGRRGFNTRSRGLQYGMQGTAVEHQAANQRTHLFAQIESLEAVQNVDAICQVEGLTGIVVGPGDLSSDMGHPGEFTNPKVIAVVEDVMRAARTAGKHAGLVMVPGPMLDAAVAAGCDLLYSGTDLASLVTSWQGLLQTLPQTAQGPS